MANPVRPGFGVGDSYDRHPGDILVFPETQLESVSVVQDQDYHADIMNAPGGGLEGNSLVAWAPDKQSPCYSHLLVDGATTVATDKTFTFTKAALELYLTASRYVPKGNGDLIVFGLRGARLKGAEFFDKVDTLSLEETRPDHFNFRCVIGYFFRATGKFTAYTASTVPWHQYMEAGELQYNLLPPGCYVYKKGAHRPSNPERWVDPAWRLSDADGGDDGPTTVLRTPNDMVFDLNDPWDKCTPHDNIHCAYSDGKFSSLGCQTVKGGMHDGLWAKFQSTIRDQPKGARVDYVLLTGAEASISTAFAREGRAVADPLVHKRLGRLRPGSEGDEVQRLQTALGLPASNYFGATTKKRLTELQKQRGLAADGIFSPAIEAQFGLGIFAGAAPASATPVAPPPPTVTMPVAATPPPATVVASAEPMVAPVTPTPPRAPPLETPSPAAPPAPPATIPLAAAASPPAAPVTAAPAPTSSLPAAPAAATARPPVAPTPPRPSGPSAVSLLARDTLRKIAPRPSKPGDRANNWDKYMDALTSDAGARVFTEFGLDQSPQRLVFILANMCAETGGLTVVRESMKYRAERIVEIFGDAASIDDGEAARLAGNEKALAERVYGLGRREKAEELGNSQPGDGFRYRGGGLLQTTGRDNYKVLGQRIGVDLENRPELIEDPLISLKAACAEWHKSKLNDYADRGSFRACCNGINYGNPEIRKNPIGFKDRQDFLKVGLKAFGMTSVKKAPGALESMSDAETLECGDVSPAVLLLQQRLKKLGYFAGEVDGQFTTETRDALLSFQANNDLALTGATDKETRAALQSKTAVLHDRVYRRDDEDEAAPAPQAAAPSPPTTSSVPVPVPVPVQSRPVQSRPVQSGPVQSGPVQSGPVQPGPVQSGPVQPAPARSSAPAAPVDLPDAPSRGGVMATLAITLIGLLVTLGVFSAIVGWLPVSPMVRAAAGDAATPLTILGWIIAVLAGLQALRGRMTRS